MPVNSFDNYPMSFKPDKEKLTSPIYLCLADMLEKDIKDGTLCPNTKLPPQRELADFLDLNLSTITKAYQLCEKRGLIHAITGKGTFVSPNANVPTSIIDKNANPKIEMATTHPYYMHNKLIRDLTIDILKNPFSEKLFEYTHPFGNYTQVQAGVKWLRRLNLNANENNTIITSGVQNALAIVLSSLFESGDKIAVDTYTYPNFISLANLLHLQLVPIINDKEGMSPDILETMCLNQNIKGIYLMPTGINPTNVALSPSRRKEIGKIIRKYDLIAIEDDNYSALLENKCPPLTLEAPDNCIYISGLSKPICPGLRIAYMFTPEKYIKKLERGALSHNLKISSLNIEIATQIIQRDLHIKIINEKRNLSIERNKIYNDYFPSDKPHLESYSQWLELPENCSGQLCELELGRQGIGVFGAERFAVGNQAKCNAIRIATCSTNSIDDLKKGLELIKKFINSQK